MKLKQFARLRWALWAGCMVLLLISASLTGAVRYVTLGAGAALLMVSVALSQKHWKCPYCGTPLVGKYVLPKRCPKCGERLDEE